MAEKRADPHPRWEPSPETKTQFAGLEQLVRAWDCPKCTYTYRTLASATTTTQACPNDGAALRRGDRRRELVGVIRVTARAVEQARDNHQRLQDPVAPWQVYAVMRALGRAAPEWVLAYLDKAARVIVDDIRFNHRDAERLRSRVAEAFGFKRAGRGGRGSVFSKAEKESRDWDLANAVSRKVRSGAQVKLAIAEVADSKRTSRSTVERAWLTKARPRRVGRAASKTRPTS